MLQRALKIDFANQLVCSQLLRIAQLIIHPSYSVIPLLNGTASSSLLMNWVVDQSPQCLKRQLPRESQVTGEVLGFARSISTSSDGFFPNFPLSFTPTKSFSFRFSSVEASLPFSSHLQQYFDYSWAYGFRKAISTFGFNGNISQGAIRSIFVHVCVTKYHIRVSSRNQPEKAVNSREKQKTLLSLPW